MPIALWRSRTSRRLQSYYNVDLSETSWHDLGVHPQQNRREASAKAVETKRERGKLEEIAEKAVESKREHGVFERAAAKAATTRKRKRKGV